MCRTSHSVSDFHWGCTHKDQMCRNGSSVSDFRRGGTHYLQRLRIGTRWAEIVAVFKLPSGWHSGSAEIAHQDLICRNSHNLSDFQWGGAQNTKILHIRYRCAEIVTAFMTSTGVALQICGDYRWGLDVQKQSQCFRLPLRWHSESAEIAHKD